MPAGADVTFPFASLMGEREIVRTSYGMSRPRQDFPKLADLSHFLEILARTGTGQKLTTYTNFISGPRRNGELDGPRAVATDRQQSRWHVRGRSRGRCGQLETELSQTLVRFCCGQLERV